MSSTLEVASVNVSTETGTAKQPVGQISVDPQGVVGDAHAGPWHRQVSLLAQESIERFAAETGRAMQPGEFAENITTRGLDLRGVAVLDRFRFGDVELEVTQIGKKCHGTGCAIFQQVGKCVMPLEGIFARVVHGGTIRPGDAGVFEPRPIRALVITLSDRAAAGVYEDRSGPRVKELLEGFLSRGKKAAEPSCGAGVSPAGTRAGETPAPQIATVILPDDAAQLRHHLGAAIEAGVDLIFTTGGTGVGPRDITPETVAAVCEKLLPGIMEHIRLKFGAEKPAALLSRSIAGVAGKTQIYTLPGSVRAVEEYMGEILKTVEHVRLMLHSIDAHGTGR